MNKEPDPDGQTSGGWFTAHARESNCQDRIILLYYYSYIHLPPIYIGLFELIYDEKQQNFKNNINAYSMLINL